MSSYATRVQCIPRFSHAYIHTYTITHIPLYAFPMTLLDAELCVTATSFRVIVVRGVAKKRKTVAVSFGVVAVWWLKWLAIQLTIRNGVRCVALPPVYRPILLPSWLFSYPISASTSTS